MTIKFMHLDITGKTVVIVGVISPPADVGNGFLLRRAENHHRSSAVGVGLPQQSFTAYTKTVFFILSLPWIACD